MLRRVILRLLAASLALAVWTVARPAQATTAPFCDDRGASAMAPPPVLEAPDVGVQRAAVPASCPDEDVLLGTTVRSGRVASAPLTVGGDPLLLPTQAKTAVPPAESMTILPPVESPREGVRFRIERPPRG
jgi:hypothetical protein